MSNKSFIKTIALPYAEALIKLTEENTATLDLAKDIEAMNQILFQSEELWNLIVNPLIHRKSKQQIISHLFSEQVSNIIINFLFVVIDRKRISFLKEIFQAYFELRCSSQSIKLIQIYTAATLTVEQQYVLTNKLQSLTNSKNVELDIIIDPSLIGGLVIKIDSKVIDLSLHGQLQAMSVFLQAD